MDHTSLNRRRLLRAMGVSTAGVAAAGAIAASREKIVDASDTAKEELAELKKQFDALDKRSNSILQQRHNAIARSNNVEWVFSS